MIVFDSTEATVVTVHRPPERRASTVVLNEWEGLQLIVPRRGGFSYRDGEAAAFVDPTTCLFQLPGQPVDIEHRSPTGDLETMLFVCPPVLAAVGGGDPTAPSTAPITPAMQLTHRRLLAAARRHADPLELQDLVVGLIAGALAEVDPVRVASGRPGTARAPQELAEDARTVLQDEPELTSLVALAARLATSPHHLSRVFHEYTGHTFGEYRTWLKVNAVLEQLSGSTTSPSLAAVAAQCGFADHAHMTRTLRTHLHATPAALRRHLQGAA